MTEKSSIQTLANIMKLTPPTNCEWCVLTYVLNNEIDQTLLNPHYGFVFPLGAFATRQEAVDHATYIITTTGHRAVAVVKYATAYKLQSIYDNVITVPVSNDEAVETEKSNMRRIIEQRLALEKELEKEMVLEQDPSTIDHFVRHAYLAAKARGDLEKAKLEVQRLTQVCEEQNQIVREHYQRVPVHEETWLEYFRTRLFSRREHGVFTHISGLYNTFRSDILGLNIS